MKIFTALALFTTLSTAYGYTCYLCAPTDPQPCTRTVNCDNNVAERCFKTDVLGLVTQGCMKRELCITPIECCEGDLCNSAPLTTPTVLLMALTTAIIALFL